MTRQFFLGEYVSPTTTLRSETDLGRTPFVFREDSTTLGPGSECVQTLGLCGRNTCLRGFYSLIVRARPLECLWVVCMWFTTNPRREGVKTPQVSFSTRLLFKCRVVTCRKYYYRSSVSFFPCPTRGVLGLYYLVSRPCPKSNDLDVVLLPAEGVCIAYHKGYPDLSEKDTKVLLSDNR